METECCVCYATTEDINPKYAASFVTIPCDGKHVMCFQCFIMTQNSKCPMCRYDYVAGVRRDDEEQEEAQRRKLKEEAKMQREDIQRHSKETERPMEEFLRKFCKYIKTVAP